jgi:hypothetical protein
MTKLRTMRWASRVARVEETTSVSNRSYNMRDVSVLWKVYLKEMKQRIRFSWLRMREYGGSVQTLTNIWFLY